MLEAREKDVAWRRWGPYLSERQAQFVGVCQGRHHAFVLGGRADTVNPDHLGTKVAADYPLEVEGGGSSRLRLHLGALGSRAAESEFDHVFEQRQHEADAFYDAVLPSVLDEDERRVARQAFGGLLWTKQYYAFDVSRWLSEHGVNPVGANGRASHVRNAQWPHLVS